MEIISPLCCSTIRWKFAMGNWLKLHAESRGRAVSIADAQIAAICIEHQALMATRNCKGFEHLGLQLINPWQLA